MLEIHLYGIFRKIAENSAPTDNSVVVMPWIEGETIIELVKRLGLSVDDLGEVFLNHTPVNPEDSIIPDNARIGLFPLGMHLLCGGQHMKGHGFITTRRRNLDYWNQSETNNQGGGSSSH
ncbi:MAG: hypothetical protein ACFFBD_00130 [Candidatus Hodarchaeota archaeon]